MELILPLAFTAQNLLHFRISEHWHFLGALGPIGAAFIVTAIADGKAGISEFLRCMARWKEGYEVKWNKGTSSLEWTSQLEDFYQTAKKDGGSFTIIVPSNFDINGTDPSFQDAYNAGKFSLDTSILPSKDD